MYRWKQTLMFTEKYISRLIFLYLLLLLIPFFSFPCMFSLPPPPKPKQETMNNSCPAIRPHSLTSNYLVHTNYTYSRNQLTIEAENLRNFADRFQQGQFWCVICIGSNCLFNLSASLNTDGTVVTCDAMEFRYPGNEAIVNATLRVVWSVNNRNIDNPQNAGGVYVWIHFTWY